MVSIGLGGDDDSQAASAMAANSIPATERGALFMTIFLSV
jgi:hypothetical protein